MESDRRSQLPQCRFTIRLRLEASVESSHDAYDGLDPHTQKSLSSQDRWQIPRTSKTDQGKNKVFQERCDFIEMDRLSNFKVVKCNSRAW